MNLTLLKTLTIRCGFALAALFCQPMLAQTPATASQPLNANPIIDSDAKANLARLAATQARLTALLKLGTPQSLAAPLPTAGSTYPKDYIWAKAQRWLDVAQDEVRSNNRNAFPQAALAQSQALISLLEASGETDQGLTAGWDTPHLAGASKIRDDLWTPLLLWKQLALAGAPVAQAGARCALATAGYTEVQLVWAGWVGTHYGWRSALPYISHAERSFDQAQAQFVACRDAAAKAAEPAKIAVDAPLAGVSPPAVTSAPAVAAPAAPNAVLNTAPPAAQATPADSGALAFPYLNRIVFGHNSSALSSEERNSVQRLAIIWHSNGKKHTISLQASADDSGRGLGNAALLRARAKAVSAALRAQGVPAKFISILAPAQNSSPKSNKTQAPDPAKRAVTVILAP